MILFGFVLVSGYLCQIWKIIQPNSCITLTLGRCFKEDDGRGQNRREIVKYVVVHRPEAKPTGGRHATTVSYSCTLYITCSKCICLITTSKTDQACALQGSLVGYRYIFLYILNDQLDNICQLTVVWFHLQEIYFTKICTECISSKFALNTWILVF